MKKLIIGAGIVIAGLGTALAVNSTSNNCCRTQCCETSIPECCVVQADCCLTSEACCEK